MTDSLQRTIKLHYDLFVTDSHAMDALAFNKAEFHLIRAILYLSEYAGEPIKVNIEAKKEGSVIDLLQVILPDSVIKIVVEALLTALISNWFRPKIHRTEEIKNRLEIIDRIKAGNYTKEEVEILLSGDKQLKKWCSYYYASIQKTNEVSQITASITDDNKLIEKESIGYKDFVDKIITKDETTETRTIEGTTIHIVSPVLVKIKRTQLWEGIYSGIPIEFKVEDSEFMEQVYNHEIKFGNGTYITCSLAITTTTKVNDDGDIEINRTYIVKDVTQWADDETFQYYTKRYKRKQTENNKQLTINFDEEDSKY